MQETDTGVPTPDDPIPNRLPVDEADDVELAAMEADLDSVDAALEALDADDLDGAERLAASLSGDDAEPVDESVDPVGESVDPSPPLEA